MSKFNLNIPDWMIKDSAKESYNYAYHLLRLQRRNWGEETLATYIIQWIEQEKNDNIAVEIINAHVRAFMSLCSAKIRFI